ncbi:MAG: hypothetical protein QG622_1137 [Actinomycetota bacterium]|nr:hypothetical protein [Actinomycetota bacterium]
MGGRRHAWVDAGRGLAILLVVFVHAEEWLLRAGFDVRPWHAVNGVLVGMRMPLFFTVSGVLGAGWLARSWSLTFSRKVGFLLWVYLVWQPIGLLASLMADQFTGHRQTVFHFVAALAATTVRPRSELWFLWALAAYFALAWACRRVPALLQLAVAAGVAAVCLSGVVRVPAGWNLVPNFHVFFLLGLHHRDVLLWTADRVVSARRTGAAIIGAWIAVATVSALFGLELYIGVGLGIRVLGLASGVVLAVWLTSSRLLRYLGSRTLPIYLAHTPVLLGLVWWAYASRDEPVIASVGPLLPLIATAVSVGASLALHAVLRRTPARYLYEPPEGVTAALEQLASTAGVGRRRRVG